MMNVELLEEKDQFHIMELKAENFKKLKIIDLKLDGKSFTAFGSNGSGKSSCLDLAWVALTKKATPDQPVKLGEDQGYIQVILKGKGGREYLIQKFFNNDTTTKLIVKTKLETGLWGTAEKSPQKLLDNLLGDISFDPFEFSNKEPRAQKEFIMELAGLDFTQVDSQKEHFLEEKRNAQSEYRRLEGALLNLPKNTDSFKEEKDLSLIIEKQKEQEKARNAIKEQLQNIINKKEKLERIFADIKRYENELEDLKQKIIEKEKIILEQNALRDAAQIDLLTAENLLPNIENTSKALLAEDVSALIIEIQEHNKLVQVEKQKQDLRKKAKEQQEKIENYEKELKRIEEMRIEILKNSNLPDPLLSFGEDGLLYDGLPFTKEQLSHAKIIDVGIGIQMALNPGLLAMRIKDGSLLDSETLKAIKERTKDKGYQLFIERVADTEEVGFIIEE